MSVLVTGGAGYIGSALIVKLLDEGYGVVSIDDVSRGDYKYLEEYVGGSRLKLVVGNICDLEKLEGVMKECGGVDAVVNLAAVPGLERCRKDPEKAVLTNFYGTYNVLEVARKFDVGRVVFISSAAVYGTPLETPISEEHPLNPENLYGVCKLAGERLVDAYRGGYGLSTVVLRFGNVYGVGVYSYWETVVPKFVKLALDGQPLTVFGDGRQSRDFVHVWDVVHAIGLVLKAGDGVVGGERFNVGTGKAVSVNAIAEAVSKVVCEGYGKNVETVYLSPREGESYVPDFCLLTVKIEDKLGFSSRWDVENGIKQLAKYYLEHVT